MDLLNNVNPTLMPGQRLLKLNGYEAAEKYPMPRDCEAVFFDNNEDYFYVKKTDTNGGVTLVRCRYEEDPIPHFDPAKYVTVDDFAKFKEEILDGFNALQQTITSNSGSGFNSKSSGGNKQYNKSNPGSSESAAGV